MAKKIFYDIALVLTSILIVGIIVFMIVGTTAFLWAKNNLKVPLDIEKLVENQCLTTKIYYINEENVAIELESERLHGAQDRTLARTEEIPKIVAEAFVSIEDHRFWEHNGIDFKRTVGAALNYFLPLGDSFGGSTITQQLVKNLTQEKDSTLQRKITEAMRAKELENKMSKEEILTLYLNTVYLSQGCYGIKTAAEYYFSKDVSSLTLVEGAALAAIIQFPTKYDPLQNPENNAYRRNVIIQRMYDLGKITYKEYTEAYGMPLELNVKKSEKKSTYSYFTEAVIEDAIASLMAEYGYTKAEASELVFNGGLSIYTTLDPSVQAALEEIYENTDNFPQNSSEKTAQSAMVIISPENGNVLGLVGGIGEKNTDRGFNLATQALRSPGSSIKPLTVYAPAIEERLITYGTVYDDTPVSFYNSNGNITPWPKNNPRVYYGLTTVNDALARSSNTVAVKILEDLGVENAYEYSQKMGLYNIKDKISINGKTYSDIALAPLALGALTRGVTVREMASAYTVFCSGGVYFSSRTFTKILDRSGEILINNENSYERVFSPETVTVMTKMMENVVDFGTVTGMNIAKYIDVAGKTGTSDENCDRWFVGYTPYYIGAVWYGYERPSDLGNFTKNPPTDIFDKVMTILHEKYINSSDKKEFFEASGVVKCTYCMDSGKLLSESCYCDARGHRAQTGYFILGTQPKSMCDRHILVDYDATHGGVATDFCFDEDIKTVSLLKIEDRSFPTEVYIIDAQYAWRYISPDIPYPDKSDVPFFQNALKNGEYVGSSGVEMPYNRACICKLSENDDEYDENLENDENMTS